MTEQYEVKAGEDGTADVAMAGKAGTKGQSEGNVKVEIQRLAAELSYCMRHHYTSPPISTA
jgi:hypothetical protein